MYEVEVDKTELLNQLKTNREKHIDTYQEVLDAYQKRCIELLEEHIGRIKNGAVERVHVSLPAPQNYEDEYDRAISMVEWHTGLTITLDISQFDSFVRDKWTWKKDFKETSLVYGVGK